jgi:hypothetical protein
MAGAERLPTAAQLAILDAWGHIGLSDTKSMMAV